ncbi:MAG: MFS transporter [Anaerolineaceae bacterium]|nr:MFS transporter [Anaerolineaceae bacterium]
MKKIIRWYDHITINIYYFALTARSQTLTPLIVPLLVQQFMGDESKGTAYGNIRLWSLMIALLVQALMGMLSDRSTSKWGRRKPFILFGALSEILVFIGIGVIASTLEGAAGYWLLFAAIILSMMTSNIGHAAAQGLIPDLVPEKMRGRFSGIKAFFELPAPLIFVSFVISKMVSAGNIWGALITLIVVVLICTILTMFVRETPQEKAPYDMDWKSFGRLGLMTLAFTTVILGVGALVKWLITLTAGLNQITAFILTAVVGVLGMAVAIGIGVWVSLRIGLGGEAKKRPSFVWWVINRLAFLVGATNLAGFVLYFIQERLPELKGNAAAGPTSMLTMFVGVAILVASLPAGWLTDKFGKKPMIAFSGFLATIGTIIVTVSTGMTTMYIGGLLIGLAMGVFYSANWALGTSIVPSEQAGRYLGLSNLAGAGAGAIGAYIGGPIGDGMGYVLLMSIFGFLFLVSTLALFGIKEEKQIIETA